MTTNPDINETDEAPDWANHPDPQAVQQIVLGELGGDQKALGSLPKNFADEFKNVTHLYLWGLKGLVSLPKLPSGLKCLHVRKCPDLQEMEEKTNLPSGLEELVIEDADSLQDLLFDQGRQMDCLVDLRLAACPLIPASTVNDLIAVSPVLRLLDCSGLPQLERITVDRWPSKLVDLRLNQCGGLVDLEPDEWPTGLRRLELQGTSLRKLSEFHLNLDYINLRDTKQLKKLPKGLPALLTERAKQAESERRLRTLLIHGSALELPEVMFDSEDFNSADWVFAHLEGEDQREPLNEVKVILVGDGRCGKSSLARRFVKGEVLKRDEPSTHGIQLWRLENLEFVPEGEVGRTSNAQLNFWDFAGQDLYHNTHRLFFQSQAIFLICGTCSGKGWDKESDKVEKAAAEMDGGGDHNLSYWRQMIDSIESASGKRPPIAFVRTKVDRGGDVEGYLEINKEALEGIEQIDFSADTGQGVDSLTKWLKKGVTQVLGPLGRREIHKNALQVRRSLQEKMLKNEKAHEAAEGTEKMAKPPHPTMALEEFQQLTKELCSGAYREHPESLLDMLHRSGFLFHDGEHMKNSVVLDQRWAINGIYAALNRKTAWPHLEAVSGRCTLELLREWGWAEARFSEKEEELFLHFMLSCGLAFNFGMNRLGQEQYIIVNALSEHGDNEEQEAKGYRGDLPVFQIRELESDALSGDAVLQLLCSLGSRWRRAGILWKWGGQFQSHREGWKEASQKTYVHMNWVPKSKGSFGGTLCLTQYGPDESFLQAIIKECGTLGGFRSLERSVFEDQRLPNHPVERGGATVDFASIGSHVPLKLYSDTLSVGISFAGDQPGQVSTWEDLPEGSIERWPLKLAQELKDLGFVVNHYRAEQDLPQDKQQVARRKYLDKLVNSDFVFCIISEKYLKSEWCMWEFWHVHENRSLANGGQDSCSAKVGAFQNARLSQSAPLSAASKEVEIKEFWYKKLHEFEASIEAVVVPERQDPGRKIPMRGEAFYREKKIRVLGYWEWMKCVGTLSEFDGIIADLASANWTIHSISSPNPAEGDDLGDWLSAFEELSGRAERLLDLAVKTWDRDQLRARKFFIRGFLGGDPDGQPEGLRLALERHLADNALNNIRKVVLTEFNELTRDGHELTGWKELEDAIVQLITPQLGSEDR